MHVPYKYHSAAKHRPDQASTSWQVPIVGYQEFLHLIESCPELVKFQHGMEVDVIFFVCLWVLPAMNGPFLVVSHALRKVDNACKAWNLCSCFQK